ncbi:MAG: TetR family transcriptional regulator [Rhodobacteraceae bacterium]|nr:TetR family transcriptional regulator [Paracoccaceae bacterium]
MENRDVHRQKGSEELWLKVAYDVLTESGVEAVKVMPLAKRLGLSRTGFYWHFRDREALLEAMIQHWERKNTGNLVAQTELSAQTVCEAVFNLYDCWVNPNLFDARLDLAIRNWARNEPSLQLRLDAADTRRKSALIAMFTRFGYDARDAEIRSMTAIYTQIGYLSMQVREDLSYRLSMMPDYVQVLTGKTPSPQEIATFMARHRDQA